MGRILDFSDGFESSVQPEIGIVTATSLKSFPSDAAYEADKGSVGSGGDLYLNTTDGLLHFHNGTSWKVLVVDKHLSQYEITEHQDPNTVMTLQGTGKYIVGLNQLYVSLNGQLLLVGTDYLELGTINTASNQIELLIELEDSDILVIRT